MTARRLQFIINGRKILKDGESVKNKLFQKHEKLLPSLILALVLIFTAFIYFIICKPLLAFTSDPVALKSFVESKGFVAQILFAAMVFLQTLIAPIPGEALEIAAGYAFGAIEGTILCITAMTVASMIVKNIWDKACPIFL